MLSYRTAAAAAAGTARRHHPRAAAAAARSSRPLTLPDILLVVDSSLLLECSQLSQLSQHSENLICHSGTIVTTQMQQVSGQPQPQAQAGAPQGYQGQALAAVLSAAHTVLGHQDGVLLSGGSLDSHQTSCALLGTTFNVPALHLPHPCHQALPQQPEQLLSSGAFMQQQQEEEAGAAIQVSSEAT
jgi:hypothetical protein